MFLIPDLKQMEVDVSVHESMGPRVRVGMKAKVKVASHGEHVIPGRVVAVNLLPTSNWKEWDESLKHFLVRVRFDETPALCLAVHVGHGRDRYRPRLECTRHPCRGHGGGGWSAVVLCRRGKWCGKACDQRRAARPETCWRSPRACTRESEYSHGRSTSTSCTLGGKTRISGPRNREESICIAAYVGSMVGSTPRSTGQSLSGSGNRSTS